MIEPFFLGIACEDRTYCVSREKLRLVYTSREMMQTDKTTPIHKHDDVKLSLEGSPKFIRRLNEPTKEVEMRAMDADRLPIDSALTSEVPGAQPGNSAHHSSHSALSHLHTTSRPFWPAISVLDRLHVRALSPEPWRWGQNMAFPAARYASDR
jgi:hypothetical protein